jgi:hypothetical protein
VASGVGEPPAMAAAAGVDDRDNTEGTAWFVYEHQTLDQVVSTATTNNLRVVDLYVESSVSPFAFTAVYVSNTGTYAKTFWILANSTPTDLYNFAVANSARIVVLKAFDDPNPGGTVRFFAVLISNLGADAKGWWFYEGKTTSELTALWIANNARITQVNSYVKGGVTLYAAVMIANTGADARDWWWYVNATVGDLSTHLNTNKARLIDLDIDPITGNYNAVMVSCSTGCPMWWWWVGVSTANLLNIVNQDGARIIDANSVPGCGDRCWSVVLINNSNSITSRVGEMLRSQTDGTLGLYLKQVGGPVLANLMDGFIYEPSSAIKVMTNLYTMRQIQAGTVTLATLIPKFVAPLPGSSCPGNTINGSESIDTAAREMMWHSDNTRTRELNDYFTTANVNLLANAIGLVHTAINHVVGCGGPIPDQTTLGDLGLLYEGVANGTLLDATHRDMFFSYMAGKAQFNVEGYDWTGLWSTDIPNIINQEAPAGMPAALKTSFHDQMDLAYKAGNYNLCTSLACTSLIYDIAISGWAKIPFCDAGGPRQFVFGTFINTATNLTNASAAFNSTKTELLREQIHAGLASCFQVSQSIQFGPISNKTLTDSPFVITATSSSDLPIDFSTNTPSVCTVTSGPLIAGVSSATVVLSRAGTCTLVAQQPGNQIFNPALAVIQTFNVTSNTTFLPLILR